MGGKFDRAAIDRVVNAETDEAFGYELGKLAGELVLEERRRWEAAIDRVAAEWGSGGGSADRAIRVALDRVRGLGRNPHVEDPGRRRDHGV